MIIWLASYPRSGNTLLRTILKRCLGLDSYADEPIHVESPIRSDTNLIGHKELPAPWPEFFESATNSRQMFLVKTHLPPVDDQPYIYVIRDGRSAVQSYAKYYARYVPGHDANIYRLIAGDDAYGDWTTHHRRWVSRGGSVRGMTVRFEDLRNIERGLIEKIAAFIGHEGEIAPWVNPLETLSQAEPAFFGEGRGTFRPDGEWPALANYLFNFMHSDLLARLGYAPIEMPPPPPEWASYLQWTVELVRRNRELAQACDERLALIDRLSVEAQRRLELIEALSPKERASR